MKYKHCMDRRTLLRGAGTIAIGLPFIEEMQPRSALAAPSTAPPRAITIFFGEGLPNHVQDANLADLSGPLEPLRPHKNKLAFVRGLSFPQQGAAHEAGGMCAFNGVGFKTTNQAGGPSIDQVMLQDLYPQGLPAGMTSSVAMGFFAAYRTAGPHFRRIRSWKNDGTPAEIPKSLPSDLFTRIFGNAPALSVVPPKDQAKLKGRRKSVLDSVLAQYKYLASDAGNLGQASRARLGTHLERLREYEQRAFATPGAVMTAANCKKPAAPENPPLFNGQNPSAGVNLNVEDISKHWRLNADLFVLAFQCDLTRFGVANLLNCGDRIDLRGRYEFEGKLVYEFNDSRDRPGSTESLAVNHEHFHDWDRPGNKVAPHHLHFHMREIAYLLSRLDDPSYKDETGGTLLDNAMVMITTELSEPGAHSVSNVLHAVGACGGRMKTGGQVVRGEAKRPALDLYNGVLQSYGIKRSMGNVTPQEIPGLRV